ncbi:MAG: hypothetical protein HY717_22865 [Planctomycetes bacterium]|nr:hypothetical protein [Planctomycetota bacterium]
MRNWRWKILILVVAAAPEAAAGEAFQLQGLRVTSVGPAGPPRLRVDLVILGDGYLPEDFGPKGKWAIDTAQLVKNFFEKLPFKTLRGLFNVHLMEVPSLDAGADNSPNEDRKRTPFNCCYGFDGIARLLVVRDEKAVLEAAKNAPEPDLILILVNDPRDGGSGGEIENIPAPVCSKAATAFLTAIHELGHSFAHLGDEYADERVAPNYPLPESGDLEFPNLTLAKFVDASSWESLVKTLKWGRYFQSPDAFKRLGNGFYEGGYYRAKGIYRPAPSCVMATKSGGGRFCFVCLDEMTRAIYRRCGRGPTGGFPAAAVPEIQGPLARGYAHYVNGQFAKAYEEIDKLKTSKGITESDIKQALQLENGLERSFSAGLDLAEKLFEDGDPRAALEHFQIMEGAFKSTPRFKDFEEGRRKITGRPEFKRELEAQKGLEELQAQVRARQLGSKKDLEKRVEEFRRKFEGTRSEGKAKRLVDTNP